MKKHHEAFTDFIVGQTVKSGSFWFLCTIPDETDKKVCVSGYALYFENGYGIIIGGGGAGGEDVCTSTIVRIDEKDQIIAIAIDSRKSS